MCAVSSWGSLLSQRLCFFVSVSRSFSRFCEDAALCGAARRLGGCSRSAGHSARPLSPSALHPCSPSPRHRPGPCLPCSAASPAPLQAPQSVGCSRFQLGACPERPERGEVRGSAKAKEGPGLVEDGPGPCLLWGRSFPTPNKSLVPATPELCWRLTSTNPYPHPVCLKSIFMTG